jgi:hypothetical protein
MPMMNKPSLLLAALAVSLGAAPAMAAQSGASSVPKNLPATDNVQTPMDDLNLSKREIPPALLEAVENPYNLQGLGQCGQLTTAIEALNEALGDDIDLPQAGGMRLSATELADFAASSFIPFRGLIRQVSGANARKREMQEAVLAGFARRSFLKGVGIARNCAYPARPASAQIIAARAAALQASLAALCANFDQQTKREQYLNRRKCLNYNKNMELETSESARPAAAPAPAPAPLIKPAPGAR